MHEQKWSDIKLNYFSKWQHYEMDLIYPFLLFIHESVEKIHFSGHTGKIEL